MSAERAAIVTGASSGIGLAIARVLCEEEFGVTMAARRPDKLDAAVAGLAAEGYRRAGRRRQRLRRGRDPEGRRRAPRASYGRLDVLVNNAGVGVGAPVAEIDTKRLDMQLDINLRSIVLFYRECMPLLREAASEHKNALVVNTSSISGKRGEAWLSVYSATKHGVVGWTEAMNKELGAEGIKSTALCPAFVDTPMTDFVKEHVRRRGHDPPRGHRRGRALPAQGLPRLRRARDDVRAARRGALETHTACAASPPGSISPALRPATEAVGRSAPRDCLPTVAPPTVCADASP